ncbi:MAG: hypothetical protein IPL73_25285 [Candidatus Obscuribacter sp.]|nr:hypothetical protein [Candidatus Obscuribacter sp.]
MAPAASTSAPPRLGCGIGGNAGDDSITGSAFNDLIAAGTGADLVNGGAGADQVVFYQGDSTAVTYADASASGTVNDGDTFTFTGGVDIVAGSGFSVTGITGDKINLAAGPAQYGLGSMALPACWPGEQPAVLPGARQPVGGSFTVNTTSGADTLVVYDGDVTAGVSQSGFVITGHAPTELLTSTNQIYLDGTAPVAPGIALATDSGTSNSDGITNVGTVNVSGIEAGATWQYSTNSGSSFSTGSGSSFVLAAAATALARCRSSRPMRRAMSAW